MPSYSYTARDQQGALQRGTLEARNRSQALAMLKERGLVPVSIEGNTSEPGRRALPAWWRAALLLLVLLCSLAAAILWPGRKKRLKRPAPLRPATTQKAPAHSAPPQQSQTAPQPQTDKAVTAAPPQQPTASRQSPVAQPETPSLPSGTAKLADAAPIKKEPPPKKPLFRHESEQILALYTRPGSPVPPVPLSRNIEADVLAALESDIVVTDADSPEDETKKEMVAWMKEELRNHLAEGGTFTEFIEMLQKRQDEESELLGEARRLFYQVARTGDFKATEQARTELNKILQEHDIPPMPMPGGLRRKLK